MSNSLFINGVWLQGSGTTFVKQTRLITKLYGQALKLRLVMLRKLAAARTAFQRGRVYLC